MTGNQPSSLSPSACFRVEREPGTGYRVTSAEGSYADEWKGRALALLDTLGQPDPKGPAEYFRWIGPITPSGEYVGVSVRLMPNGEARYHQAWFQVPKAVPRHKRFIGLVVSVLLVGLLAGAITGRTLFVPDGRTPPGPVSGNAGSPGNSKPDVPPDMRLTKLKNEVASSREVRAKLREYLSQEGLAADKSNPVINEKRSVKLIADLDRTPPPQDTISLNNVEVARLLKLIETLDEWTTSPKPSPKSEGR